MAAIGARTEPCSTTPSVQPQIEEFPSIPRAEDLSILLELEGVFDKKTWIVTEKTDGANFRYYYAPQVGMLHASRGGSILTSAKSDDVDSQYPSTSDTTVHTDEALGVKTFSTHLHYDENVKTLFEVLRQDKPELVNSDSVLVVYGEYAGPNSPGSYVSITKDGRYCDSRHARELKPLASADGASVTKYRIPYTNNEFYAFKVCIDNQPLDFETMEEYLGKAGIPCVKKIARIESLQEALNYDTHRITTRHEVSQKVGDRPVVVSDTKLNTLIPTANSSVAEVKSLDVQAEGVVVWDKDYGVVVIGNHSYNLVFKKKTDLHKEKGDRIGEVKSKLKVPEEIKDDVSVIRRRMKSEGANDLVLKTKTVDSMTIEAQRRLYPKLRTDYIQKEIIDFVEGSPESQLAKQIFSSDRQLLEKNSKKYIKYFLTQVRVILNDSVLDSIFGKADV